MLSNLSIPQELRGKIDAELQPGERIRWVGQPVPRFITTASIGSVLFGILWTSFAIFWMWGALGYKLSDSRQGLQPQHRFALFGVPFVLIGFGLLSSPILVWQSARKTVYLVTDKRAIPFQGGRSAVIRTYLAEQLKEVYGKDRADGTGDLILSIRRWRDSDGDQRSEEMGFWGIRSPREVERVLRQIVQNNG